jgi:rod shape-determining protein MreD
VNKLVFAITTYIFLALQNGLTPLWTVRQTTPNLLLILAVFIGVSAGRTTVMGSMLILGLLLDLQPGPLRDSGIIVGPHAVGFLVGGYAVLQLRNLLFRESVITIVLLVLAVGGFAALVETVLYVLRGLPWLAGDPLDWSPLQQLWRALRELIYTAIVAVPVGLLLQSTRRLWNFAGRAKNERMF